MKIPKKNNYGKPLLKGVRYCTRCCMPETQEGIIFDELGICQACQSSEQKMHINWSEREKELKRILEDAKLHAGDNYDCIIPISGGKDSMFQMHVLTKIYGMKPLAVTFSHSWFSETGYYNLFNCLETFNVDHIMFTPARSLVNRIALRSIEKIGDACWHCHAGVGAFALQIAVKFKIPLLIWGESIAESSGRASYFNPKKKFDYDYFTKVSAKLYPEEMTCSYLSKRDLYPFFTPTEKEYRENKINGIHLGDYIFWDEERQVEFIKKTYGWKETKMAGTYKHYKGVECIMTGLHDFMCYLKRGYGRGTSHASSDVRAGLLTRDEGFSLIKKTDRERPEALDYFLNITGLTEKKFYEIMTRHRLPIIKKFHLPIKKSNKRKKHTNKIIKPYVVNAIEVNKNK